MTAGGEHPNGYGYWLSWPARTDAKRFWVTAHARAIGSQKPSTVRIWPSRKPAGDANPAVRENPLRFPRADWKDGRWSIPACLDPVSGERTSLVVRNVAVPRELGARRSSPAPWVD